MLRLSWTREHKMAPQMLHLDTKGLRLATIGLCLGKDNASPQMMVHFPACYVVMLVRPVL